MGIAGLIGRNFIGVLSAITFITISIKGYKRMRYNDYFDLMRPDIFS